MYRNVFIFFVHKVLYIGLLLMLSGDVELNPGPLNTRRLELLKTWQDGQATILRKLEAIDTRLAKHEAIMAEINGKFWVTEGRHTITHWDNKKSS